MIQNIVMTRGDSKLLERTLMEGGLPIDLTGATVTFTVENLFTKTTADGIDIVLQSAEVFGDIEITVDPADTADSPDYRAVYRYDIEVVDSGDVTTPLRGHFIVLPDVTL